MGEGWSDAMADWTEQTAAPIRDFTMGSYVKNNNGIRSMPYSTNMCVAEVDSRTYAHLRFIGKSTT
jgi:extracellular elastinolytic metalloproteinase